MLTPWPVLGNYRPISVRGPCLPGEEQLTPVLPLTSLSLQPSGGRRRQMNSLNTDRPLTDRAAVSGLSFEARRRRL